MSQNKTVTINGRQYDTVTGLPVEGAAAEIIPVTPDLNKKARDAVSTPAENTANHAAGIHALPQKSKTLHRRSAKKKPTLPQRPQPGRHMDIARSSKIAKFAPHPHTQVEPVAAAVTPIAQPAVSSANITPVTPAVVAQAVQPAQPAAQTPKQIKDSAIARAMAHPSAPRELERSKPRWTRRTGIIGGTLAVLLLAGYFTYTNMPSLSVGIASAQAGIEASFPKYKPDGFSLAQPVTYKDGEVEVTFASNSGDSKYAITQTRSSWDSSAVLDNVVRKFAGDNYVTTQERGLTIFSYDNSAVWVNGGIMYKIAANAPLSGDQIRRIATSL